MEREQITSNSGTGNPSILSAAFRVWDDATMFTEMNRMAHARARRWSWWSVVASLAISGLVFLGWTFDAEALKRVVHGCGAMNPLTAVSFMLLSLSLGLRLAHRRIAWKWAAPVLAALVAAIGLVRLVEYAIGTQDGIDSLLFASQVSGAGAGAGPTGMGHLTAICFVLSGLALMLLDVTTSRGRWASQPLAVLSGYLAFLALLDVAYDIKTLQGLSSQGVMALHTAVVFVILALGTLCARPDRGVVSILIQRQWDLAPVRLLFLTIIVLPPVIGAVALLGRRCGLFDGEFSIALVVVSMMAVLGIVFYRAALALQHAFNRRVHAEEHLRLATTGAGVGTWHWDVANDRLVWSDQCRSIFGIAEEASVSYGRFLELLHPHDRRRVDQAVQDALKDHTEYDVAYRCIWPDGSVHWIAAKGAGFYDADGCAVRMEGVVTDITRRMEAKRSRDESERNFRMLAQIMPQMVWTTRPDGHVDYFNQRWVDFTGMTFEQTQGWDWKSVIHPEDLDICLERWSQALRSGQTYEVEYRIRRASDGAYRWHLGRAEPRRDEDGRIVKWFGTCTDIDDQKRLLAALQERDRKLERINNELEARVEARTAELTRSNKELEQFAYVASHDLQQPLRMVTSYMQLLENRYKNELDDDAREFINYAVDGASRMKRLIDDLLSYSRLNSGDGQAELSDCEIVLARALGLVESVIQESGATVTHDPLPAVVADETQLTQLFQNLIGNAVKYRGDRPPRVHIRADQQNGEWLFSVQDNGIGFEPRYAERIFLVFQRLHTKEEYAGTGIGLAICKKVVERHGGRIWVESQPGRGSTFYFTIPCVEEAKHDELCGTQQAH